MLPEMKSLDTLLPQFPTVYNMIYQVGVSDNISNTT